MTRTSDSSCPIGSTLLRCLAISQGHQGSGFQLVIALLGLQLGLRCGVLQTFEHSFLVDYLNKVGLGSIWHLRLVLDLDKLGSFGAWCTLSTSWSFADLGDLLVQALRLIFLIGDYLNKFNTLWNCIKCFVFWIGSLELF